MHRMKAWDLHNVITVRFDYVLLLYAMHSCVDKVLVCVHMSEQKLRTTTGYKLSEFRSKHTLAFSKPLTFRLTLNF